MTIPLPKRIRNHVNPLADLTEHQFEGFSDNKPIIVDVGAYRGEFTKQLHEQYGNNYNFIVT